MPIEIMVNHLGEYFNIGWDFKEFSNDHVKNKLYLSHML